MAALRAEWLMQIAEAIESAQKVAWHLRTAEDASPEARDLYGRLEVIRTELKSLRDAAPLMRPPGDTAWLASLGLSNAVKRDD